MREKMFLENYFLVDEKFEFTCREYANVLVATWYDKAYDLMFADALSIGWSGGNYLNSSYIDESVWNKDANLERYHGVSIKRCDLNECRENCVEIICREIERGNPVGLTINIEEISYFHGKSDDLSFNIAIVVGVDIKMNIVYYRVMHNRDRYTEVLHMSFEELNRSIMELWLYDNHISGEGDAKQISCILSKVVDGSWESTIQELAVYSDYFVHNLDFQKVIGEYKEQDVRNVPLISNSAVLYRSRAFFSFVLSYIGKKYNDEYILQLADQLMISAGKFYNIRGILLKCYYQEAMTELHKQKISEFLRKIVEIETYVLEHLKEKKDISTIVATKNSICDVGVLDNGKYDMIELDKYFNSRALAKSPQNNEGANFDGMGGFFVDKEYPYGEKLCLDDMYIFNISKKSNMFDNISCCGQEIKIGQKAYRSILIMASASHGNFKDYMTVVYESERQEKILLSCSSCWYPKAHFKEAIIWQGEYVAKENREQYYIEKRKLNIYAQKYAIEGDEKIDRIILPDCPDMHIFAITLFDLQ